MKRRAAAGSGRCHRHHTVPRIARELSGSLRPDQVALRHHTALRVARELSGPFRLMAASTSASSAGFHRVTAQPRPASAGVLTMNVATCGYALPRPRGHQEMKDQLKQISLTADVTSELEKARYMQIATLFGSRSASSLGMTSSAVSPSAASLPLGMWPLASEGSLLATRHQTDSRPPSRCASLHAALSTTPDERRQRLLTPGLPLHEARELESQSREPIWVKALPKIRPVPTAGDVNFPGGVTRRGYSTFTKPISVPKLAGGARAAGDSSSGGSSASSHSLRIRAGADGRSCNRYPRNPYDGFPWYRPSGDGASPCSSPVPTPSPKALHRAARALYPGEPADSPSCSPIASPIPSRPRSSGLSPSAVQRAARALW